MRKTRGSKEGIVNAILFNEAQTRFSHPAHGSALLAQLRGEVEALTKARSDDPLLQACQLIDALPRINGYVSKLQHWADVVSKLEPDAVPDKGARLCR